MLEPNILKYIWRNSKKEQLIALMIILASMPTYFLSLELPKQIVNGPIQGVGFDNPGDVANFMKITLPLPGFIWSGEPIVIFNGLELERVGYLMALSFSFLLLVTANGLFKLFINTYKGRMGERLLRRLRFQLFDRVLRFPLSRFRRTKASEVSSMIKDEVEPLGEFIGDAYTMPLFEGGQALTALVFIFLQEFYLGCLTIVIIVFQAWLVPRLRKPIIRLGKQRQVEARLLSGRLGEVVEGITDVHTNDTSNYERSNISSILGRLFFIRFDLYQRKFAVKFINNFLLLFLQFLFYALGGYFAIRGTLDVGQLVAVIAAFKDLPGPVRGLINWDQRRLVVEARYSQIVEQFTVDDMMDASIQRLPDGPVGRITNGYKLSGTEIVDETGSTLLERTNVELGVHERIAVVGPPNSGASEFSQLLSRVAKPTRGQVELDGNDINSLPEYFTGRRIAYLDSNAFFPQSSILHCMTYVLKRQPIAPLVRDGEAERLWHLHLEEARRASNSDLDEEAEWIDYAELNVSGEAELTERIRKIFFDIGFEETVRGFGLRGRLDPQQSPELCEKILEARNIFRTRLTTLKFDSFVEPFDPEKYNDQSSIGENLLFGTAVMPAYEVDQLASNAVVRQLLRNEGLETQLFDIGKQIAATTVELFGDLSADNPFFDQLDYMDADDLPEYRAALSRIGDTPLEDIAKADQELIMRLPFVYIESKNRLGLVDDALKKQIVNARFKLRELLSELETVPISFYDPNKYNPAASVLDNILLGRVASNVAEGPERVHSAIADLLDELNMTDEMFRIGLDYNVGSGGKRLNETQRQKLHLARALLKQPDILIVNQALNALDASSQRKLIEMVLESARRSEHAFGVVWVPVNPVMSKLFDRVLLFDGGELIADNGPDTLENNNETYKNLLSAA